MKIDTLDMNDPHECAEALRRACLLGADDERHGRKPRTGAAIADALARRYRRGHVAHLRHAYMAGRFTVTANR